jgi:hypothetical protein
MNTLLAGISASVVITVGEILEISGNCEISISGQQSVVTLGRFGPYPAQITAQLKALGVTIYEVKGMQSGVNTPVIVDNAGAKIIGLTNPDLTATMVSKCFGSGIPFVMPPNGNITSTSGGITAGTAFDYVIGPSYSYFPANNLNATSAAGWYYTNWTSTTVGTVFADTYTNGSAQIPTSPAPLTTVVGAYTQVLMWSGQILLSQQVILETTELLSLVD